MDVSGKPAEHEKETRARTAPEGREHLWTPLFVFIIVMTLCTFVVGQGLNSGTSVYLDHLGMGATFAGILAAVFSAAAAIARLVSGLVIDNVGRVGIMLASTVLLLIGTALPVFVSGAPAFTVCRILQGIGFSAATTAAATAASDVLPLPRLGEGIGYYGLGQALAMSIGPALALFLVNTEPPENLYLGLSAMAALAFVFTLFCRYENNPGRLPENSEYRLLYELRRKRAQDGTDETRNEPESQKEAGILHSVLEPRALSGTLPMLVLSPAFGFGIFFMGLYGTSLGYENAGLFYTVSAISMIAVRLTSRLFMDRVAPIKIMAAAVACGIVAYLMVLGVGHNNLLFILSGLPYGLCVGIALPLNQAVAVKNTPPERWGACNALYLMASDIGIGGAAAVWGVVNDAAGFSVTIVCVLCCIVASLVVAWFSYPREADAGEV
ncbi:MAG TPA: MFS transporter [Eggerthellaceae bacterium]|nr:MFS transporter [Eggerthellaceae bacterium]